MNAGPGWADLVGAHLARLDAAGRRRSVSGLSVTAPRATDSSGRDVINFASNDYLGLAGHPLVVKAAATAARVEGAGSGSARLITGTRPSHARLEESLAAWKGAESAVLFSSGYAANLGVMGALAVAAGEGGLTVLSDELNHASIIDGIRLARAQAVVYPHGRPAAAAAQLGSKEEGTQRPSVIVSDSVFSMDGDLAPVPELVALAARHRSMLVLDDAHVVFDPGAAHRPPPTGDCVQVGTLSKTLGTQGGYVVGDAAVIELIRNVARSFIFTTASAPPAVAGAGAALDVVQSDEGAERIAWLRHLTDLVAPGHPSPIVPIVVGDAADALEMSARLRAHGLVVPAIRPPTVPEGTSRLRVTLSAEHSEEDVDRLLHGLDNVTARW